MTKEQEGIIIERILLLNEILNTHTLTIGHIVERIIKSGDDFDGRAGAMMHGFEQLEAVVDASKSEMAALRAEFGLPPIPPAGEQG